MSISTFSCEIGTTNPALSLGMEIWFDDQCVFNQEHVKESQTIKYEFNDDAEGSHELRFVLKNKLSEHTVVDADGKIISDATLTISNISFDEVDCQYLTTTLAEYHHDFNGTAAETQQKFYGSMGCNGTVSLKFSTPVYIWLLENL
jgi:hypothetical protein